MQCLARAARGTPRLSPVSSSYSPHLLANPSDGLWLGRKFECPVHDRDEIALFAQNKPLRLRHLEIRSPFRIRFDAGSIGLVRRKIVKRDQTPRNVVRAFIGQKISDQVAAAAGNDAAPVFSIF